jgi:FkbM family methyltransferase
MKLPLFWIRVLNKLRLLPLFMLRTSIKVNGKKITLPLWGSFGLPNLKMSDAWMTPVLVKLKPLYRGYFVDVGVNLGQTLIRAYSVFGDTRYTGFEPNPACVHYVQELIRLNNFRNCDLLPMGISDKAEVLKLNFFFADETDQLASIVEKFRPDQPIDHFIYVPVFDFPSIKHIIQPGQHPILKIDVEGAESEVLKGCYEWIATTQPIILIEILPAYSAENIFRVQRQQQIEEMLRKLNYRMARIQKGDQPRLQELDMIGISKNIEESDYIFYPAASSTEVLACFTK